MSTLQLFSIKNINNISAQISNYGAKILSICVPDRYGNFDDIVLGFDNLNDYMEKEPYFGAVCGRFANRIKNSEFTIDGKKYYLPKNDADNHLHGGVKGFESKYWEVIESTKNSVSLSYVSPDGEENYPGNLKVTVTYELSDEDELKISFKATTDKTTVVNLCNHAYFNLNGAGSGTIYNHFLYINADFYTVKDSTDALTGEIRKVKNTSLDFRQPTLLGPRILEEEFIPSKGIDNNWAIRKNHPGELALSGYVYEPVTGRKIEVYSTQPGLQVYTGNWIENQEGKGGKMYDIHSAICLETQGFPNSPNVPFFPTSLLHPDQFYDECCIYKFTVE